MSSKPRRVGTFAQEFEFWPLPPDEEALTLKDHRPPGYFDCDDIAVPTPKEEVERGMAAALQEWADYEVMHGTPGNEKLVRIPPGIKLRENEEDAVRAARVARAAQEREAAGSQGPKPPAVPRARGPVGGIEAGQAPAAAPAAATAAEEEEGGRGGENGGAPPALPSARTEDDLEAQEKAAMLEILDLMPDYKAVEARLRVRMRSSQLALPMWRHKIEQDGPGMRDFRRLPFLRKTLNVVQPMAQLATAADAGPYAVEEDEPLLTVSTFGHRASMLYRYQDYLLLARNTLLDLHRMMYCTLAAVLATEGEKRNLPEELTSNILAFFFIEGKFYVTQREEGRRLASRDGDVEAEDGMATDGKAPPDYIDAIRDWVDEPEKERRRQLGLPPKGGLEVLSMERAHLGHLELRLGTRYLYCHLGECEHHFSVSDLRLPTAEDHWDARQYPMVVFQKHYRKRRCMVCDVRPAKFCALSDPWGDDHKMVYCEFCHFRLHYDAQGHLLRDDFKMFPYIHD